MDCEAYGNNGSTCSRVTLYCNPHDQVISALSVQGIGWRGMNADEIRDAGGDGIFTQRVFAQGYWVGKKGTYHYWKNHYKQPKPGTPEFWVPKSPEVKYSVGKGLDATKGNTLATILTIFMAPIAIVAFKLFGMRVNAIPDKNWEIPIDAPELKETSFTPQARRFGETTDNFDQTYDAPGQLRDKHRVRDPNDPYAGDRTLPQNDGEAKREATDAGLGDADTEASMRYEDHARLRMEARREGLAKKSDKQVVAEDDAKQASADYKTWREKKIKTYLADNVDEHATDHSTIMTNGMHAQKALAYDVAIGLNYIRAKDMHQFRIAADWRFLNGLDESDPNKIFKEYFTSGYFTGCAPLEWTRTNSEGRMPEKIVDIRQHPPLQPRSYDRQGGQP